MTHELQLAMGTRAANGKNPTITIPSTISTGTYRELPGFRAGVILRLGRTDNREVKAKPSGDPMDSSNCSRSLSCPLIVEKKTSPSPLDGGAKGLSADLRIADQIRFT